MAYTINTGKELAEAPRPVVFCDFVFPDGTERFYSSIACTFNTHVYTARISQQDIGSLSALAESGVDRIPSVGIKLQDPGGDLFINDERGLGFKGAKLTVRLAFADLTQTPPEFSTDYISPYLGICDQPEWADGVLTVTTQAKLNLTRYLVPAIPIQRNCPWANPSTVAQRALASDVSSPYYFCGETRDLVTAPPCAYTKPTCTQLLRFGGVTYDADASGSGREYISGEKSSWRNADMLGRYKKYWPLWLGGWAWADLPVLNQIGDGNYTRGEVAVGFGAIELTRVIVNGVELAHSNSGDFRWHYVNQGARDGTPNPDVPYNSTGDPAGNLTMIQVLAPKAQISPESEMNVRVLGYRKTLRVYRKIATAVGSGGDITVTFVGPNEDCAGNPPFSVTIIGNTWATANGTHTLTNWTYGPPGTVDLVTHGTGSGTGGYLYYDISGTYLGNPACSWPLMELLSWTRFAYDELDVDSFADVAAICNVTVGGAPRFATALALTERRSAAEVVRGIRQAAGLILVPGSDGKLKLRIEGPLCEQQAAAVDGSNYNTPVASITRLGANVNGYLAYLFDASNSKELKRSGRQISDMPNRVQFAYLDRDQGYAVSTYSIVDSDDAARIEEEQPGGLQVEPLGIASQNHAVRAAKLGLAKIHRGNPTADTRGTDWWEWQTSFRACKLWAGAIVGITNTRLGLTIQQVRITEVKPDKDFRQMTLRGYSHDDSWYLDSNGDTGAPGYVRRAHDRLARPAYPWQPNLASPISGDSIFAAKTFKIEPSSEIDAQGNWLQRITLTGKMPVNSFSSLSVPSIAAQATITTTGGTLPASSRIYVAVSAQDAGGKWTPMSNMICLVDVPAGATNMATIAVHAWDASTISYRVFAGVNPNKMCGQFTTAGMPSSFDLLSLVTGSDGPPDVEWDRLMIRPKRARHLGILGTRVAGVAANQITIGGTWVANALIGYDVSLVAKGDGSLLTVADYSITANTTGGVLTVTPNPIGTVVVNDVVVVRSKPTVVGSVITDALWNNSFSPLYPTNGLAPDEEIGGLVWIIAGPDAGQVYPIIDNDGTSVTVVGTPAMTSASRYVIVESAWLDATYSTPEENADPDHELFVAIPTTNLKGAQLLLVAVALDSSDSMGFQSLAPMRDVYLLGSGERVRTVTTGDTQDIEDGTVLFDTTGGAINFDLLPFSSWPGRSLRLVKTSIDANTVTVDCAAGDTIDGSASFLLLQAGDSKTVGTPNV